MLEPLVAGIGDKKAQLDRLRPLSASALAQLQKHYDVDLTYTSNAIEGNALTLRETAEVIEHGVTVGGKSLRDHLEAVDHYEALLWMRALAAAAKPVGEETVCELHRRIVARSQPDIAGIYSRNPRRIAGSPVVFANPARIPELMEQFGTWLKAAPSEPDYSNQTKTAAYVKVGPLTPLSKTGVFRGVGPTLEGEMWTLIGAGVGALAAWELLHWVVRNGYYKMETFDEDYAPSHR